MGNLTTSVVGTSPAVVYGAPGSQQGITVLNLDTANTVWLGYTASIAPGNGGGGIPVGPLASMQFDGSTSLYAVAAQQLTIGVGPGVTSYSAGSLTLNGPVTAEITGPVEVEGSVSIEGTPTVGVSGTVTVDVPNAITVTSITDPVTTNTTITNTVDTSVTNTVTTSVSNNVAVENAAGGSLTVAGTIDIGNTPAVTVTGTPSVSVTSGTVDIGNTPAVTVSGTPSVSISSGSVDATITGTTDVSVQNATIDVVGSGGFVLPGQISTLYSATSLSVAAGATWNTITGAGSVFNISGYQSVDFLLSTSAGSTASGAAYCATLEVIWVDPTGTYAVAQENLAIPVGGLYQFSVPCKSSSMFLQIQNLGSTGTISFSEMFIVGSFRNLTAFQWNQYNTFQPANDTTVTWAGINNPAGIIDKWLSSGSYSISSTSVPVCVLMPPANGLVNGFFQAQGSPSNNGVVVDMSIIKRGGIPGGTGTGSVIMNMPSTATAVTTFSQNFPVCVPALVLKSTTSGADFQFTAIQG